MQILQVPKPDNKYKQNEWPSVNIGECEYHYTVVSFTNHSHVDRKTVIVIFSAFVSLWDNEWPKLYFLRIWFVPKSPVETSEITSCVYPHTYDAYRDVYLLPIFSIQRYVFQLRWLNVSLFIIIIVIITTATTRTSVPVWQSYCDGSVSFETNTFIRLCFVIMFGGNGQIYAFPLRSGRTLYYFVKNHTSQEHISRFLKEKYKYPKRTSCLTHVIRLSCK